MQGGVRNWKHVENGLREVLQKCERRLKLLSFVFLFSIVPSLHTLNDFGKGLWSSKACAVLAYLYRELCCASLDSATEISGPITLLQLWSWDRLHVGRPDFGHPPMPIVVPHVHDDVVDGLHDHLLPDEALPIDPLGHKWRVLWEPYTADLTAHLPTICQADEEIWRIMSPLICFDIIKWHRPDSERIATAPLAITTMDFYDPYMQWYRRITRRLIAPVLHRDHMRFHREDHRVYSTHEPSTYSRPSMRPPSLIMPVRVPSIRVWGKGGRRDGHRHVPLASTLPSISLDLPFFPHVTSIHTFSLPSPPPLPPPSQPSISLDAPPPITESIAPPPVTESITSPPITESIAPLPFLQGTAHVGRLHVRVPRGHRAPRVCRVLLPSVPSNSTAHVDDVSQSIEMETFQIA
ncbi:Serine/threonine-protein phosphatase 7 long form-like [Vitis vinifera]|uniref:Serine/threonine-protein phosphatase 7 long form-like n=1 Tax=Vitis vinifera TaxID=29760 RepID=A0A438BRD2_VITVI|nr:Serine/threonine-protein phosphatase 7 long form-like [Vitis vinifera]